MLAHVNGGAEGAPRSSAIRRQHAPLTNNASRDDGGDAAYGNRCDPDDRYAERAFKNPTIARPLLPHNIRIYRLQHTKLSRALVWGVGNASPQPHAADCRRFHHDGVERVVWMRAGGEPPLNFGSNFLAVFRRRH